MGEYEPDDSRKVTLTDDMAPGEPPRTGFREGETRQQDQASQEQQMHDERADRSQQMDPSIENPDGSAAGSYGSQRDVASGQMDQSHNDKASLNQAKPTNDGSKASYGNSQDEQGQMEQDLSTPEDAGTIEEDGFLDDTDESSAQLRGDAKRPLSGD